MQSRIDDISKIIKEQIKNYSKKTEQDEIGYVISVGDGISKVHGLDKCKANELLEFSNGTYGMALNLEESFVSAVLLGNDVGISEGSLVKRTGRVVSVPVGEKMIGRVVNALGQPIDAKGPIETSEYSPIERRAYGIIERKSVSVPLQTGIKAIDSMIPIGKGQRELIIGDRQTGKTAIALDTILFVLLTISPSLMPSSDPKRTHPTLSCSRFNAIPKTLFGNSNNSPSIQSSKP